MVPSVLIGLHTALIAYATIAVAVSSDGETAMVWLFPYYIDYPVSQLIRFFDIADMVSEWELPVFYFVLGIVYWGLIGIIIQSVWRLFVRPKLSN